MAKDIPNYKKAADCWAHMNVQCPICNKTFNDWFCPYCGLPKNNSSYYFFKDGKYYYCGQNHLRRNLERLREFQLCSKCYAPNPYNAKYCKSCGENISTQARDINGHGWIDLGLSVLWATEFMDYFYVWGTPQQFTTLDKEFDYKERVEAIIRNRGREEDVATKWWGDKWRTPTKEEFEELVMKCKWEKCIDPSTNDFAFKVIGPNGNSIIIPVPERAGDKDYSFFACSFWTSSKGRTGSCVELNKAFAFVCSVKIGGRIIAKDEKIKLWLDTPVEMHLNVREMSISFLRKILPVADKKSFGKI
jgi:ribosomal protein L40E